MTDRLSTAPTDAELAEYLQDNLHMSALAWHFPGSQFSTEHRDEAYLRTLGAYSLLASGFVDRIVAALLASLKRLNALPRDDEFWGSRTASPTLYKLRDFNAAILQRNPDDVDALWAQASLYIVHGSGNFGAKQWRRLHYVGAFDAEWPILAALVTEIVAGPTLETLVELVDRIEQKPEALAVIGRLDGCGDPWILDWCATLSTALRE